MTGVGSLFATQNGTNLKKLRTIKAELMTQTRRGGQSANRIARIRDEQREYYYKKVVETCIKFFSKCTKLYIGSTGEFGTTIRRKLNSDSVWNTPIDIVVISTSILDDGLQELTDLSRALLSEDDRKCAAALFDEIYQLITTTDLCVFGDDIQKYADEYMLKCIYSIIPGDNTIHVNDDRMNQFGGQVGILYYPIDRKDEYEDI